MSDDVFKDISRIVIKIGTSTLTYPSGMLNLRRIEMLSRVLTDLRNQGKQIMLVSSGAVAVGADRLGLKERPRDIMGKQAASAVGQAVLMQIYENFFITYNQKVAQILLTKDVLDDEIRKVNARNTFFTLLSMGVIPIVNENDTVSTDELGFSENDNLSAYVARLTESGLLIILTDTDGLYDSDPRKNPNAKKIDRVDDINSDILSVAGESSGKLGTGGMTAKITAAGMAIAGGVHAVIASGDNPEVLYDILEGKNVGTLFFAKK